MALRRIVGCGFKSHLRYSIAFATRDAPGAQSHMGGAPLVKHVQRCIGRSCPEPAQPDGSNAETGFRSARAIFSIVARDGLCLPDSSRLTWLWGNPAFSQIVLG